MIRSLVVPAVFAIAFALLTRIDTAAANESPDFRATGNEPGWVLEIGPEALSLDLYYGETRITVPLPAPETGKGLTRYMAENVDLTVTIIDRYCTDTMSGMPHPYTVILVHEGEEFSGCGGDPAALLGGGEWVMERIADAEPIDDSRITLWFGDDNRVAGSASCNRYMGRYTLTGESLSFGPLASTKMACAEPVMEQEIRYLELLQDIRRFELDPQGRLILYSADDETTLIAHRADE